MSENKPGGADGDVRAIHSGDPLASLIARTDSRTLWEWSQGYCPAEVARLIRCSACAADAGRPCLGSNGKGCAPHRDRMWDVGREAGAEYSERGRVLNLPACASVHALRSLLTAMQGMPGLDDDRDILTAALRVATSHREW